MTVICKTKELEIVLNDFDFYCRKCHSNRIENVCLPGVFISDYYDLVNKEIHNIFEVTAQCKCLKLFHFPFSIKI